MKQKLASKQETCGYICHHLFTPTTPKREKKNYCQECDKYTKSASKLLNAVHAYICSMTGI